MALALPIPYEILDDVPEEDPGVRKWLWTRDDFHRAIDLGVLTENDRIELINGELYEKFPQKRPHSFAIQLLAEALQASFGTQFHIQQRFPVGVGIDGEPEPDIAVIRGSFRDYVNEHPTEKDVALIVEVSDWTLRMDRRLKGEMYARAGIPEYWILNLQNRHIECYREPTLEEDDSWYYRAITLYREKDNLKPVLAKRNVKVSKVLPPRETQEDDRAEDGS